MKTQPEQPTPEAKQGSRHGNRQQAGKAAGQPAASSRGKQAVITKGRQQARQVVSRRVALARSKQQDREVVSGDEEHGATDTRGEAGQQVGARR